MLGALSFASSLDCLIVLVAGVCCARRINYSIGRGVIHVAWFKIEIYDVYWSVIVAILAILVPFIRHENHSNKEWTGREGVAAARCRWPFWPCTFVRIANYTKFVIERWLIFPFFRCGMIWSAANPHARTYHVAICCNGSICMNRTRQQRNGAKSKTKGYNICCMLVVPLSPSPYIIFRCSRSFCFVFFLNINFQFKI